MTEVTDATGPGQHEVHDVTLANGTIAVATKLAEIWNYAIEMQSGQARSKSEQLLAEFSLIGDAVAEDNLDLSNEVLIHSFVVEGTLSTGDGQPALPPYVATRKGVITKLLMTLETNGDTSGATTIDVDKNGTTINTTQGNRPSLAHDSAVLYNIQRTIEIDTFTVGDILTMNIDAIPGTASTGLTVEVYGYFLPNPQTPDAGEITRVVLNALTKGVDFQTSIQYFQNFDASGPTYNDFTTEAKEATDNDVELLPAAPAAGDYALFGCDVPFDIINMVDGTDGVLVGDTFIWEYPTAQDVWATLTVSGTSTDFSDISDPVSWTMPSDWVPTTEDSQLGYYVRARISAITSTGTVPLAKQINLGIAAVVDVNIDGTTIYTTQSNRAILHASTANVIDEFNAVAGPTSIEAGTFAKGEAITADIDYAAPAGGTEPVDLKVQVFGSFDNYGSGGEDFNISISAGVLTITSTNPESTSQIRLSVRGRQ